MRIYLALISRFLTLFSLYKQELKAKMEKMSPFKGSFKECKKSSYKPTLDFWQEAITLSSPHPH